MNKLCLLCKLLELTRLEDLLQEKQRRLCSFYTNKAVFGLSSTRYPLPALASASAPPFICDISYDEGQASRETLNGKHFHKACLKDFFDDLVDRRQVKESDIACPKCQRPIETRFLQLISPERFTEYSDVASLQVMDTLVLRRKRLRKD